MAEIPCVPAVTTSDRTLWSVVIPVHDCAHYLARMLPEVVAQLAYRSDAEIIVVDDVSADDPAQVVKRLCGDQVQYLRNERHLGAIATFNRCLEVAGGEFVHLLHGDDAVRPGFYRAMESALSDPTIVAAVCRVQDVDADGNPIYITRSYRKGTGVWTNALEAFAVSNRVRAPGIVVRRSAYEDVGGYLTDLPHAADWEMWTRLAGHGPLMFVDEVLACYRRHEASDTSARTRTGANVEERIAAISVVARHIAPSRRPRTTRKALAYSVVFACRTAISLIERGDWPAARRQLREASHCLRLLLRGVRLSVGPR